MWPIGVWLWFKFRNASAVFLRRCPKPLIHCVYWCVLLYMLTTHVIPRHFALLCYSTASFNWNTFPSNLASYFGLPTVAIRLLPLIAWTFDLHHSDSNIDNGWNAVKYNFYANSKSLWYAFWMYFTSIKTWRERNKTEISSEPQARLPHHG